MLMNFVVLGVASSMEVLLKSHTYL